MMARLQQIQQGNSSAPVGMSMGQAAGSGMASPEEYQMPFGFGEAVKKY